MLTIKSMLCAIQLAEMWLVNPIIQMSLSNC